MIKRHLNNAIRALTLAPEWQGVVAFDEFAQRTMILKSTPWRAPNTGAAWKPLDDLKLTEWLQQFGVDVDDGVASKAVEAVAAKNPFHPVKSYLGDLAWDGTLRLDTLPEKHLGVEPTVGNVGYVRAVFARWCISAVARIFQPGCQADYCLILEGEQGKLKSSLFEALGQPWFTDSMPDMHSKDASMATLGAWIIELSDLASMKRSEIEATKAFLTRRKERVRLPYGRRIVEWPRQCVFAATTNRYDWLNDETGGRRFWPLRITSIALAAIEEMRDQIWAEARDRYLSGEPWYLDAPDVAGAARSEQTQRLPEDAWEEKIRGFVVSRTNVVMSELLELLGIKVQDWEPRHQQRVSTILTRRLGWKKIAGQYVKNDSLL